MNMQIGASENDFILASLYGLGDTYLIAALGTAFRQKYCRNGERLFLLVKESHRELAEMFGDVIVHAISDAGIHTLPLSSQLNRGQIFCPHINHAPTKDDWHKYPDGSTFHMTDKAMIALILGLSPEVPLTLPTISDSAKTEGMEIARRLGVNSGRTAILFPRANSWPLLAQPSFWNKLVSALTRRDWHVVFNNENTMPLRCIIPLCETAGWVIGANSGIMQTFVIGQAYCRKTILSPAHMFYRKVDGHWYDIEEHVVDSDADDMVVHEIVNGARDVVPSAYPLSLTEPMISPGEVVDRLTILCVKRNKMPNKKNKLLRDIAMLEELCSHLVRMHPEVLEKRHALYVANIGAWDANEILISMRGNETNGDAGFKAWLTTYRFNQDRVRLKNELNVICGSRICEEKSYT